MSVVGILPMAGAGGRLGLPFPKPLAPTAGPDGLTLLYEHAAGRLREVTDDILAVVYAYENPALTTSLREHGITVVVKRERDEAEGRGEMPSSLALVASGLDPEDICAVALPDTIWRGKMARLMEFAWRPSLNVVLGLFGPVSDHILDTVETRGSEVVAVRRHLDRGPVSDTVGWGCFLARATWLATLTDRLPMAAWLDTEARCGGVGAAVIGGDCYHDLGTPERYLGGFDAALHLG